MDIVALLSDKTIKPSEKTTIITDSLLNNEVSAKYLLENESSYNDKQLALILSAMEAASAKNVDITDIAWLKLAEKHINSESNSVKREASRIIGNIACKFNNDMDSVIAMLMKNTKDSGTVVRWAAAYALGRIITIEKHAKSNLFDALSTLAEEEENNGVKNQYLAGLKKAKKLILIPNK